jgi:hypothetical protein
VHFYVSYQNCSGNVEGRQGNPKHPFGQFPLKQTFGRFIWHKEEIDRQPDGQWQNPNAQHQSFGTPSASGEHPQRLFQIPDAVQGNGTNGIEGNGGEDQVGQLPSFAQPQWKAVVVLVVVPSAE